MHFMLLVELPPSARRTESALDLLGRAMEPFYSDCDGGWTDADYAQAYDRNVELPLRCEHKAHNWDWWELGGRYTDFFQSVAHPSEEPLRGVDAATRYNKAMTSMGGRREPEPERDGYDLIRKKDVDWEAMAARKMRLAGQWWDEAHRPTEPGEHRDAWIYDVRDDDTRDSYIVRHTKGRTYAILTAEGEWIEKERYIPDPNGLGRFEETPDWDRVWDERVAAMPADALLAIVDYHN